MYGELESCRRCHRRFPVAFGHVCARATSFDLRADGFETDLLAWLATTHGRFAEYLARRQRGRA